MLPNQERALQIARDAIEVDSFDTLGFYEFFDDDDLTYEDIEEIQEYISQLVIPVPDSWKITDPTPEIGVSDHVRLVASKQTLGTVGQVLDDQVWINPSETSAGYWIAVAAIEKVPNVD